MLCSKSFVRKGGLKDHLRDVHQKSKQQAEDLVNGAETQVVSRKLNGSLPSCDICKKSFSRLCNLVYHMNATHVKEKSNKSIPISCTICTPNVNFASDSNLKKHIRNNHPTEYLRSYSSYCKNSHIIAKKRPKPQKQSIECYQWRREEDRFLLEKIKSGSASSANVAEFAHRFNNKTEEMIRQRIDFLIVFIRTQQKSASVALVNGSTGSTGSTNPGEMDQEHKIRKKVHKDTAIEPKVTRKSAVHKRIRLPSINTINTDYTDDTDVCAVQKNRIKRIDESDKNEAITGISEIERINQDPLLPEENVHFNESINGYQSNVLVPLVPDLPDLPDENLSTNSGRKSHEDQPTARSLLPMLSADLIHLLQTQIDFRSTYDRWHAHQNDELSMSNGRNVAHSAQTCNFREIRTNVYSDSAKPIQCSDIPKCSCTPKSRCGDDCLNRLTCIECDPKTCPCGDECQNTCIQKRIVVPVERFMTQNKGWGIRSKQAIKKDTFILEYIGEVVNENEYKERMRTQYKNDTHHYGLHLHGALILDGHRQSNECRFANHSCQPNCVMQKWSVCGLWRMVLFARRDILPGEELTFDYKFTLFDSFNRYEGQVCRCESVNCRGVMSTNSHFQPFKLPGPQKEMLIAAGHCFLLRNLKKVVTGWLIPFILHLNMDQNTS